MPEITINRDNLVRALKPLEMVCEKDQKVVPALRSMYLCSDGKVLKIETTNTMGWVEFVLDCKGSEDFEICLPSVEFAKAVRSFDGDEVKIEHDENYRSLLRCGKSRLQIPGSDPTIFPTREEENLRRVFSVSRNCLLTTILQVFHARDKAGGGKSSTRGQALHFQFAKNNCVVIASNNDRFAKGEFGLEKSSDEEPYVMIIPEDNNSQSVSNLIGMLQVAKSDVVILQCNEDLANFTCGDVNYQCRLKEGSTYKFDRVKEVSEERGGILSEFKFPRLKLASILARAKDWGEDKLQDSNRTFFFGKGKKIIVNSLTGDGTYKFTEEIDVEEKTKPFFLSVRSEYMLEAVEAIQSPEVLITFPSSIKDDDEENLPGPFRVLPADETELFEEWFMPMQINDEDAIRKALDL